MPPKLGQKMSDVEDDAEAQTDYFDPNTDLEALPDKKRKKLEKTIRTWRAFIDFIFRHIAIITFKYNCFEKEDIEDLLLALQKAENVRANIKLKKGEEPRVASFRVMREAADQLEERQFLDESNKIRRFLDIAGRMRALGLIAGGFVKALKKGKVKNLDNIKHYADFWKGFTSRSYDFTQLELRNADPASFSELGQKFMTWPVVIRTALYLAQQFLKLACDSTGQKLLSADVKVLRRHTQAAEFVVAARLEEQLKAKVDSSTKNFLIGNPLLTGSKSSQGMSLDSSWDVPDISEIDAEMIRPMPESGMLLDLPTEPPKDGKGKKGGKKGGKKSGGKKKK